MRVEKNYYEALHYSIYTPSDAPGSTERIDNVEVSQTSRAYPANCTANIRYWYADALTATTSDVKTVVPLMAFSGTRSARTSRCAGAPAIAIKELAGHSSIAVTNRYMHPAPGGAARNAIALLETGRQVGDSAEKLA